MIKHILVKIISIRLNILCGRKSRIPDFCQQIKLFISFNDRTFSVKKPLTLTERKPSYGREEVASMIYLFCSTKLFLTLSRDRRHKYRCHTFLPLEIPLSHVQLQFITVSQALQQAHEYLSQQLT